MHAVAPNEQARKRARPSAAAWLGFDDSLTATLPADVGEALNALSYSWFLSCVLLAFPLAVAVYKTEHGAALALGAGCCAALLTLNALRLIYSGSGVATHLVMPEDYRPKLTLGLIVGVFALMMSQPAQLLLLSPEADATVAAHRAELIVAHRKLLSSLNAPLDDGFADETADCEFVVLRLALLWDSPIRNVIYSGFYLLLVLSPFLLSRTLYLEAIQTYEQARHRRAVWQANALQREADEAVALALRGHPTYTWSSDHLSGRDR